MIVKHMVILALILVLLAMTACGQQSEQDDYVIAEPLTLHHYFSGTLSAGIEDAVQAYNSAHPEVEVKSVPIDHEAYKVSLLRALEEGRAADFNSYWAGARTASIVQYLEPLDDVFEEGGLTDLYSTSVLESACVYDGQYYLVPITQHYVVFYYNVETFMKYGLEEPRNWQEFIDLCETLKANGVTPIGLGAKDKWPAQFWFDYLLLRTSANTVREGLMKGEVAYTDPSVVQAVEHWKSLLDAGYFNADAVTQSWDEDITEKLMNGEIGLTLMGSWLSGYLNQEGYEGQYGVFSFPVMNEEVPHAAVGPIDGIVLTKNAVNTRVAKDAIVLFSDKQVQLKMAVGAGGFSPNQNIHKTAYSEIQQEMLDDIEQAAVWAFNYDLATNPEIAEVGLDFFIEFLEFPDLYIQLLSELEENVNELR